MFLFTSRQRALKQASVMTERYTELAQGISDDMGRLCVEVLPMRGVDEDMRRWSFYMILEHNAIVNRSITATVCQLARGEPLHGLAKIDPKRDVMPSLSAGNEQLKAFQQSVKKHSEAVMSLGRLRGTELSAHPIFGDFDGHKWNCMFSFHLRLHYRQAVHVVRMAKAEQDG
jgi:hypothetical protein